jgi:hypothetical protein
MNKARLITSPGQPVAYTADRETDARTALARGLAEYLAMLVFDAPAGRELRFDKVLDTWAEPEDGAKYPRAVVQGVGIGVYDASSLTPGQPTKRNKLPAPDGRYLISACSFVQDLSVEVWTNDPPARRTIVGGLESAFNPVDFMFGFLLELPFYFNERATYSLKDMAYQDSEQDAMRRYRKAVFTITGEVPVVNLFSYPLAKPSFRLDEVGQDVVIPGLILTDC